MSYNNQNVNAKSVNVRKEMTNISICKFCQKGNCEDCLNYWYDSDNEECVCVCEWCNNDNDDYDEYDDYYYEKDDDY